MGSFDKPANEIDAAPHIQHVDTCNLHKALPPGDREISKTR